MAENPARKVVLSVAAVVLVGALGGLGVAIAFKKVPGWLKRDQSTSESPAIPDPLFYTQIGDSPVPPPGDSSDNTALESKFTIEIAKLSSRDQAESLIKNLAKGGLDAYYTPLLKDGRVIYRVRYGIFDTEAGAKSAAKSVQTKIGGMSPPPAGQAIKVRIGSM